MALRRVQIGGQFALTDHHGAAVTDETYRGSHMLIFFGFTHCRMVCPAALAKLSQALEQMGDVADSLTPLYITVDPERDTPERMREFLEADYPRFTGLTGDPDEIERVKGLYKVWAERAERDDGGEGYDMPHTAMTFLMGPDGAYLTHFANTVPADEIATRVVELVRPA